MIQGPPDTPLPLRLTLEPAFTDRGVEAFIRKVSDKSLVQVVVVTHAGEATYLATFTHSVEEYLAATFVTYTDTSRTTIDTDIGRVGEDYRVVKDPPSLEDIEASPASKVYENRMVTVFDVVTCDHEVLVWADLNGQRVTNSEDATIIIKDGDGAVMYTDSATTPNSDGVFKFNKMFTPSVDTNYYVVILIKVDGLTRVSHQTFFTLG